MTSSESSVTVDVAASVSRKTRGDNQPLSRKRPKRITTNEKYASFAYRILKGYGARVKDGDIMDLADLLEFQEAVDEVVRDSVKGIMENGSYSWGEIGKLRGMSRQGARQKWGR